MRETQKETRKRKGILRERERERKRDEDGRKIKGGKTLVSFPFDIETLSLPVSIVSPDLAPSRTTKFQIYSNTQ
jgi:hypothetical protein